MNADVPKLAVGRQRGLTALFFDIEPDVGLTPISATLYGGSVVYFGPDGGGNVGGEWAYAGGLTGAPGNTGLGISSSGFDLFGDGNFGGANLQDPAAVDGLNYGLTSAGDDLSTGNQKVTGSVALIKNAVLFTLSVNGSIDRIENVRFQYGTSLGEANITPVPEPTTMIAGILLFLPLGASLIRILRRHHPV